MNSVSYSNISLSILDRYDLVELHYGSIGEASMYFYRTQAACCKTVVPWQFYARHRRRDVLDGETWDDYR